MNEIDTFHTTELIDYEKFIGAESVDRIAEKAHLLRGIHMTNVNATYYGGGVAGILSSFILLINSVGIKAGWRVIQGTPDFFSLTKKMHNALQGAKINLSRKKKEIYENIIFQNSIRNHLDHDLLIIHDPQSLPMIDHYRKRGPWIWRCHIDLSQPDSECWDYLKGYIEKYDAVVVTLQDYKQELKTLQVFIEPAIDPFSSVNKEMSEKEINERLEHYGIPDDLPLVVQISRFDRWKDPEGVIRAYKKASEQVDCRLVLLGNVATDDPEGEEVYKSLLDQRSDRILIKSHQDTALVNALQRKARVVLQKSIREGFGLTVTEAMWKQTPVIGGNTSGIRYQIEDGVNGFLVDDIDQAAEYIVELVNNKDKAESMGKKARESVKNKFLLSRYLENYLDLILRFKTNYVLRGKSN